ncbi:hypothetical protein K503DRAFT_804239 [Rhizopogon vinicolor AM-OR11-026]|uniref:Uncharacterized protein n=1 Tax=Rhizopogon vinicolor AM-OR11-026 TaxID=1314800 RepID=A0A1B7MLZ8_9AGAM|nr:hypothetical protein K503DRAFT_804239 [Rhizopogon vinicolor AM-OR11-026]
MQPPHPVSEAESPGDVLPDSVINDLQPDTISQTTQLPHPASEAEPPGDVLPDSIINDSQPSHPASEAKSPGDLLPDSALESWKWKRPEEESTSSVLNAALTSRPRLRPHLRIMHSHPSTNIAYWDDPEFFRSHMSGSRDTSVHSSQPPAEAGFHQGLDGDVPPRNTVGAESNDVSDEEDALQVHNIVDESSSGSNYSADEQKRKNVEKQKYTTLTKYSCNRIMHSPLPDSSPPSSPDYVRNIHSPLLDPSPPSSPIGALVMQNRRDAFKSAIHRDGGNARIL